MDDTLFKLKKEIKDIIYATKWELQDKDLETNIEVLANQADMVEAIIDEYYAVVGEEREDV